RLGLSQCNYGRAAVLLGSWDGNVAALVSAHQSIGVAQPLLLFGTEEQKQKYLPRVAGGEISAFALTERHAGSDPATMSMRAEPSSDGSEFVLNGEKLWCTNGVKAGVLVVMAHAVEDGRRERAQANNGVHCRCRYARTGDYLSLPVHGIARALQRSGEVHRRASAAREYHLKGRRRVKGRAHNVEHRAPHIARSVRWPFQTAARNLAQMGK